MLLVTGTKRSGTSMWMQILRAAGIRVIGDAFPKDWKEVIRDANPHGFFESRLRDGIYFATNPSPRTGDYLRPEETQHVAVKVFIPGVIKSDIAFVGKVLASMRNWREYDASLRRLYRMEAEGRRRKNEQEGKPTSPPPPTLAPALEWWRENYALIGDVLTRRYPIHMVAYESVLEDPERIVREAVGWLGVGDADDALTAVDGGARTQTDSNADVDGIEPAIARVFDEFYQRVRDRAPLEASFIAALNDTNVILAPRILQELKVIREKRRAWRRERWKQRVRDEETQT